MTDTETAAPLHDGPLALATWQILSRPCPHCGVSAGAWCNWIEGDGALNDTVHLARFDVGQALDARFQVLKDQETRLRAERDAWKVRAEDAEAKVRASHERIGRTWNYVASFPPDFPHGGKTIIGLLSSGESQ